MDFKNAVIAIATEDGVTVSSHFGRAPFYEVLSLSNGKVIKRERREKTGHLSFVHTEGEQGHHHGEAADQRHQTMVSPIMDCKALIVRGIGQGAVEHVRQANIQPILTSEHTIDEVLSAIASDTLESDPRRIHQHHEQR
jgi:predicted Fe-Mo cluster-binding NifX family protein